MNAVLVETPVVKLPKADAMARIAKNLAALRVEVVAAKTTLDAAPAGGKYAAHFQFDALKKRAHFLKAQIARIKKDPKAEVIWSERFGA